MELDAVYRQVFVLDAHNDGLESCSYFETIRDFEGAEAVVPACLERVLYAAKDAFFVMRDSRRLAVHRLGGVPDRPAEVLDDDLMAEAHAEYRQLVLEVTNRFERNSGSIRRAGAWRNHEQISVETGGYGFQIIQRSIGAIHPGAAASLAEIVDEVVRERIKVVDEQDFSIRGFHSLVVKSP